MCLCTLIRRICKYKHKLCVVFAEDTLRRAVLFEETSQLLCSCSSRLLRALPRSSSTIRLASLRNILTDQMSLGPCEHSILDTQTDKPIEAVLSVNAYNLSVRWNCWTVDTNTTPHQLEHRRHLS